MFGEISRFITLQGWQVCFATLEGYKTFFFANKVLKDNKLYDKELMAEEQKQDLCIREIKAKD